jgi:protein SCO1
MKALLDRLSDSARPLRVALAAMTAISLAAFTGCGTSQPEIEAAQATDGQSVEHAMRIADDHADPHAHHAHVEAGEHTGHSIYNLESSWWDQHGETRTLGSLGGRVQVMAMVYTHCAYTCPQILMDMKRMEAQLAETLPGGVGFVLVSIDPERDDVERLSYFAESTRLDPARWTLLGGSDGDVLELATLLGIKYRRDSEVDFSHSNSMLVLNPAGEIVFRQDGLGEDLGPMIAAIRAAATTAPRTGV